MSRKLIFVLSLFALLSSLLYVRFNQVEVKSSGSYSVHNLNTGLNYTTIQEAIDAPETLGEHAIFVERGTYYENLVLHKSVSLVGENRTDTVIDGESTGNVVEISASNVSIINFTIRNGGKTWGGGFPDSCVLAAFIMHARIENNTLTDAAVGILGWASTNITIRHNLVRYCGLMGMHLDGGSNQCTIAENPIVNNIEGVELERSSGNLIEGNSNIVNNKTVYYFTNHQDLIIDPSDYLNLGYLAVVNCTNIMVKDFNITRNGDGVLLAYSTNCTLTNMTLSGNRGPLMYGGLTFYESSNNTIVNNKID